MDENVTPAEHDVRRAYGRCRRLQRRHDPTFFLATRCLPAERRPATHALYGFLRGADEIVDGPRRASGAAERRATLDAWHASLLEGLEVGRSSHPVLAALVDAGLRHDLPLEHLSVYMESMRLDCGPVRIRSVEDLDRYMNGSAASVGRVMAPILGLPEDMHEDVARLGLAFQLTNFIRDVAEDWELDRVYLPGVVEDDLRRREVSDAFRAGVAAEVERARELFSSTDGLCREMTSQLRPGVRLARTVYLQVLDRVERLDFDVLRRRASLPPWELAAAGRYALRRA